MIAHSSCDSISSGSSRSARASPAANVSSSSRRSVEMYRPRIRSSASSRSSRVSWRRRLRPHRGEPGCGELVGELLGRREPLPVDLRDLGKDVREPEPLEVLGGEGGDDGPPARAEDPRQLREGRREVDEVHDEAQDRPLEPCVLEGKRLGAPELEADPLPRVGACPGKHLGRCVDPPHPSAAFCERLREDARPAADVEDTPPRQVALGDEDVHELPPVVVDRSEPVVGLGERPEVGRLSARQ